jgi:hypothetical protein
MTDTLAIFVVLINVLGVLCGIAVGMQLERRNWNKLIEEGKLPKPGQKWHRA